jgi:hypothetical protein
MVRCVRALFLLAILLSMYAAVRGQDTPPATAPELVVPPGFARVSVGRHTLLVEPENEPWSREAIAGIAPTTQPTTMPADLLQRIAEHRDAVARQMQADLAIDDPAVVQAFIDDDLIPAVRRMGNVHPRIVYMIVTRDRLKQLLRGGWENPRFRYNRLSDEVSFNLNLTLASPDVDVGEQVIPVTILPEDTPQQRHDKLVQTITGVDAGVAREVSAKSQFMVQMAFVQFIGDEVIRPLKLSRDQEWFGIGLAGVLSASYAAPIDGVEFDTLLEMMTREDPRAAVKAASVDLLKPVSLESLREEYLPHYIDAERRKATRAIAGWIKQADNGATAKVLRALRTYVPPDGEGLVKVIQEQTGIDLTAALRRSRR